MQSNINDAILCLMPPCFFLSSLEQLDIYSQSQINGSWKSLSQVLCQATFPSDPFFYTTAQMLDKEWYLPVLLLNLLFWHDNFSLNYYYFYSKYLIYLCSNNAARCLKKIHSFFFSNQICVVFKIGCC